MRDSSWPKKKDILQKFSTLRQTTDYIINDDWNEILISSRAEHLYTICLQIWWR